jgi:ABC-2 type transport system permease protein
MTAEEHLLESVRSPFLVGAVVVNIGVVVTIQGTIIGEKDQGTAAWMMSKPVSRTSFVMSKIVAHSFGFLITAVLVPAILFAVILARQFPGIVDYGDYAIAVSVMALSTLFYVALTTCLGTLFNGRGPVAGLGITFILTGQFFNGMLPEWLVLRTPWTLGNVATSFGVTTPLDWSRTTPIVATAVATVALCALAVWRFGRDEF